MSTDDGGRRRGGWGARLAALALGTAVALGGLELAVRLIEPGQWARPVLRETDGTETDLSSVLGVFHADVAGRADGPVSALEPGRVILGCYDRPTWDYFDEQGCVEYRINALGFRDTEFAFDKQPDELRVLALGDSFTFGIGVQLEDAWPQVLERGLTDELQRPVQVINAGFVAGYMPTTYVTWLAEHGQQYQPDLVLVGLCLNDMGNIPMMAYRWNQLEDDDSSLRSLAWARHLLARGELERAVAERQGDESDRGFDFTKRLEKDPRTWQATAAALVRMDRWCEQRGIRFAVAVLPMVSRLDSDYPFAGLHELVRTLGGNQGVEVVDLFPALRGRRDSDLWAHPTDQHPNDVGQALLAGYLLQYLREHPEGLGG